MGSRRVQVIVDEEEREAFRQRAITEGVSLSTWLREAGHRRLSDDAPRSLADPAALRAFFAALADLDQGREPEWDEHLAVITASRRDGAPRS